MTVMLFPSYHHHMQAFQQRLEQLRDGALQAHPDPIALRSLFLDAQQLFQMQINTINVTDEWAARDDGIAAKLQAAHTEIHKYLRLVGVDVMFLQTARQPMTRQKRQADLGDRLQTLIGYCQAILTLTDAG